MLPNAGPFQQLQQAEIDPKEMARTEAIINSMTAKERTNADILNGSRRRRVAAGSGTTVQQVNQLLKQYRQARDMMKGMAAGAPGTRRRRKGKRGKRKRGSRPLGMGPGQMGPGGMDLGKLLGR